MELWIRSQDREKLLKVNDIAIEINMIYGYFDKNTEYELLGSYKSKERALEVLDQIHQRLIDLQTIEIEPSFYKIATRCLDIVYLMPKK